MGGGSHPTFNGESDILKPVTAFCRKHLPPYQPFTEIHHVAATTHGVPWSQEGSYFP